MRILLIEDDEDYLDQLVAYVEQQHIVDVANNGTEGTYLSEVNEYDAIIVGDGLSDMCPEEVCRETREAHVNAPILCLSECSDLSSKLKLLDAGADYYASKPINIYEINSKLKAILRRRHTSFYPTNISKGLLEINFDRREIRCNGISLDLRRKGYDVLEYLLINMGRTVSKEELLEHIWAKGLYVFSNTVEVHIKNIRDKLKCVCENQIVKTVRGFGYKVEFQTNYETQS